MQRPITAHIQSYSATLPLISSRFAALSWTRSLTVTQVKIIQLNCDSALGLGQKSKLFLYSNHITRQLNARGSAAAAGTVVAELLYSPPFLT
jgi:hypothetical protein